jgi:TonB family protein
MGRSVLPLLLAAAAGLPAAASAAPAAAAWTVVQRLHACEINQPDQATGDLPTFSRPFRGETQAYIPVARSIRGLQPFKVSRATLRSGPNKVPVQASLVVVIETRVGGRDPQQIVTLRLDDAGQRSFRTLLGAPAADIVLNGKIVGQAPLPPVAAWEEADRCLERVGQALLTASPPPGPGGVAPPRDKPLPQQAPSRWLHSDTYPVAAMRNKAQGDTRVSVTVDRYGYPTACRVLQSAGHGALDAASCDLILKRGRFFPALDKAGAATGGEWETIVRWRLGAD